MTRYTVTAPSNIAFIKYWGKRDAATQWPFNDSLSMTLSKCQTVTSIESAPTDQFFLNGQELDAKRSQKIFTHIARIRETLRTDRTFRIESSNSFPEGAGIASSASGLCALTLAVLANVINSDNLDIIANEVGGWQKLAHLVRLGSGSACRSLFGGFVEWKMGSSAESQSVHAVASNWKLCDVVLIVSDEKKAVSSTDGHALVETSPLFEPRLAGIPEKMDAVKRALNERDLEQLGPILEQEALEMHAVALTSTPSLNYLKPASLRFIGEFRRQRFAGKVRGWFTIDAGPNIHIICEEAELSNIEDYIKSEWPSSVYISDVTGCGPILKKG